MHGHVQEQAGDGGDGASTTAHPSFAWSNRLKLIPGTSWSLRLSQTMASSLTMKCDDEMGSLI